MEVKMKLRKKRKKAPLVEHAVQLLGRGYGYRATANNGRERAAVKRLMELRATRKDAMLAAVMFARQRDDASAEAMLRVADMLTQLGEHGQ